MSLLDDRDAAQLPAGAQLGQYRIRERLGAGGKGVVYCATDTRLGRDVAIKVLPGRLARDPGQLARFEREARMLATLNHPNIATIHGLEDVEGVHYLVMELVPGETLAGRIRRQGRVPIEEALALCRQIVEALETAHRKGIIHRDIKPSNVIVTPEGRVKVLDFGLAKAFESRASSADSSQSPTAPADFTMEGQILGTPAYMSPEQARGRGVDQRSDIWAVGCVLYELLAGRRAFEGETLFDVVGKILERDPDWQALPPSAPSRVHELLRRCLHKDASRRWNDSGELKLELDAILQVASGERQPVPACRPPETGVQAIRALAVLPLTNLSGDPEQQYFADGMTEALISNLAKLRSLRVISRTSVMRYRVVDKPLPEIARELNVDAVVEGSVFRAGQRVRITVQLIHGSTDTHLWADSYDGSLQDVLGLQKEVAQSIAREIQAAITQEETGRLTGARPVSPEAYEAYLKGRYHFYKLSPGHLDTAQEYFRLALEKDPDCALAHAGIAMTWFARGDVGVMAPREAHRQGAAAASRAIELDDTLADAHEVLGNCRFTYEWDWDGAEREFQRAIRLNPNSADAHFFYSDFLISMKRTRESIAESRRALDLDPLNVFLQCFLGWHLIYMRRTDEAIAQLRKVLQAEPNFSSAHLGLWGAFYQQRSDRETLAEAIRFFTVLGDTEVAETLAQGGPQAAYTEVMRPAAERLAARGNRTHVPAVRIARLYAHAGMTDRALEWLNRAYEDHEPALVHLAVGWDWDSLRPDPRFQDLLRRIGLPLD